jgi:hypothetical protein
MFGKPAFREGIMHIIQTFEWYSKFKSKKTNVEDAKKDMLFGVDGIIHQEFIPQVPEMFFSIYWKMVTTTS